MTRNLLVIVEDDVDLLEGWTDLFEFSGYSVRGFTSATAALEDPTALDQAAVLISDYHLADRNGLELIREARLRRPELPAVILTGLKQESVANAVTAAGVELYYKPVDMDALEACVERLMNAGADAG